MKKKGFTLIELLSVIIVLGIVAVIAFPTVNKNVKKSKERAYETQVSQIEAEAKRWAIDHTEELPEMDGSSQIGVNVSMLIEGGYITKTKDGKLYDPRDNNKIMDGCVVIEYSIEYNQYTYKYDEKCNVKIPKKLSNVLKEQYIEGNTVGLVKDTDGSYYYKGTSTEVSNNFVWFGGHLWRVLAINADNTLTMVTQQPITAISHGPYVTETADIKETYETSKINQWLNDVFYYNIYDKSKIQLNSFNLGAFPDVTSATTEQYVGLLDEAQYIKAGSTDSFLDIKNYFCLGTKTESRSTRCVSDTGTLFQIGDIGGPGLHGTRPVIRISDLNITDDGNGSLQNAYKEKSTSTNTSNVKVGEYISVPTTGTDCGEDHRCLFRVVSKDRDSVKVILNGLLSQKSVYGDNGNIFFSNSATIYTPLIEFANSIDEKFRYTGNKVFYIGAYLSLDYNTIKSKQYQGNVGLPMVGEMFSGNDINLTFPATVPKSFVNTDVIENPTAAEYFWMMNPDSNSNPGRALLLHPRGYYTYNPSTWGVRPTLFINKGTSDVLTFKSGNGTAEHPYILGD